MRTLAIAIVAGLALSCVPALQAQQSVIDWNPGALVTNNSSFDSNLSPVQVSGPTEIVNNYINDATPVISTGTTGTYNGPNVFSILQASAAVGDGFAPSFNLAFIHDSQSQARFGIRDVNVADHESKNISTLVWLDDADFTNPVGSVADLVAANIGAFVRGDGPSNEFSIHMAVLNGTQWYLSESKTTETGINAGSQVETGLQVNDFSTEMWAAFTPATSSSNAFVSTAGLTFNTASSSLNDVQGLGYFMQDLNDTIDPPSESRLYSKGFSYTVGAPPTEFVTEIAITSLGTLGPGGVRINNLSVPGATLTRDTGVTPDAANMNESETWTFTLSNIDLDDDGNADDSLSFQVDLASTFANGSGEPFDGQPDRYLHERVDVSGASNADYNGDNIVDVADYTIWRDNLGASGAPGTVPGDGAGDGGQPDGVVDTQDYELWRNDFGAEEVQQPGGGLVVEPADVEPGSGDIGEGETLQLVASNLTYSLDGGADQVDGAIEGFLLVDFDNVVNQDTVDINGSTFGFAGSTVINLGEGVTPDVTAQWAGNTLPISETKLQGYSIEGFTLRVNIPLSGAGAIKTVPEPAAAGLVMVGLTALGMRRRW